MPIITPEAFHEKHNPSVPLLTMEELEKRINDAIEKAARGTTTICVDIGGGTNNHENQKNALAAAGVAGWSADLDGRSGALMLAVPARARSAR